jgi:hypothetical protein
LTPKPDNSQAQVQCLLTLCAMHAQNFWVHPVRSKRIPVGRVCVS